MRIVAALGGNALHRRGEALEASALEANVVSAAAAIAGIARRGHELVVTHGNGPQIGLLALQAEAYADVLPFPLDVLGAESMGMIGYLLERELRNEIPERRHMAVLTQVLVDADDPAFFRPTKPIGPLYDTASAARLTSAKGWTTVPEGAGRRRAVASPEPRELVELETVRTLVEDGTTVIAAGGGGIPVVRAPDGRLKGVEAVIDKDLTAAMLAAALNADELLILTDVEVVFAGWGTAAARPIRRASPDGLGAFAFESGTMEPKIRAACNFVRQTGGIARIGALARATETFDGISGTTIARGAPSIGLEDSDTVEQNQEYRGGGDDP